MSSKGFTLIEAIIILVIVAIAVPALMFARYDSSRKSGSSEIYLNALYLAEGKMEQVIRFKNVSGFNRVIVKNFDDTSGNFNRTVSFAVYSSWGRTCNVTVTNASMPDGVKLTTLFTNYSSL